MVEFEHKKHTVKKNDEKSSAIARPRGLRQLSFFIRNERGFPIACVHAEPAHNRTDTYAVGMSVHNPIDPFNKKVAHEVALGRARALQFRSGGACGARIALWVSMPNGEGEVDARELILNEILNAARLKSIDLPTRVMKALEKR